MRPRTAFLKMQPPVLQADATHFDAIGEIHISAIHPTPPHPHPTPTPKQDN